VTAARFQRPAGFTEVHPSSSNIWWEDVAGSEHKELWLVRAPVNVSELNGFAICYNTVFTHTMHIMSIDVLVHISLCKWLLAFHLKTI